MDDATPPGHIAPSAAKTASLPQRVFSFLPFHDRRP